MAEINWKHIPKQACTNVSVTSTALFNVDSEKWSGVGVATENLS